MDREEDQRVAAALRRQGLDVSSVWDLVHTADDYRDVVPLLVTMLNRTTDYDVKEGIVRALSLKSFRSPAFEALVSALEDLFDDMSPRADTQATKFTPHATASPEVKVLVRADDESLARFIREARVVAARRKTHFDNLRAARRAWRRKRLKRRSRV